MPDLLINPPSSPGWLRLQRLHVQRDAHISALLSSQSEICVQRVLVGVCGLALCWPLPFTASRRNRDQERTVELIFFVAIKENRKRPDLKYVCLSYGFCYSVFFTFRCHSHVPVNLNANFPNKKSLRSICVVLKFTALR